jgi:UDP-N-acetylmuramoylalanine--D-glutamate ligase
VSDPDTAKLRGKRVTVMGLGLQGGGVEVVRYLASRGARITVTDQRPAAALAESLAAISGVEARLALGGHDARDFESAEIVIANPAVGPSHPMLAAARAAGAEVTSEMALFLAACPARIALITGTQGKSSTTNAAARLLEESGFTVHLGGNIGRALIASVDDMRAEDVAVVEISSYQLEALPSGFGPCERVAAVACVNVLADHLERHGSVEAYEAAKRRILDLAPASATVVLSADDPRVSRWTVSRGRELRFGERAGRDALRLAEGEFRLGVERLGRVADLRLPGAFQRTNVLAALGIARALGAPARRLEAAIGKLSGLEHRLQDLGVLGGRRVWDNAVSTTPDSTLSALLALERPVALLVGGQAKSLPLDELVEAARTRARRVIAFGGSAATLAAAFRRGGIESVETATVEDAVRAAYELMEPGEELLFSPACASFDAYRNFRDRALAFRRALPPADTSPGER